MRTAALLLLLLSSAPLAAAVVHVRGDAGPGGDGTTWGTAVADLAAALAAAASGDQVWVAAGTYLPGTARTSTFAIPGGVAVYGGFAGDEDDPARRHGGATLLSGDVGAAGSADNCYHVVTISGAGDRRLDRLAISGGNADSGQVIGGGEGGGIRASVLGAGALELVDCTISGNRGNGGSAVTFAGQGGASISLVGCRVLGNRSAFDGGTAHLALGSATASLTRCVVADNRFDTTQTQSTRSAVLEGYVLVLSDCLVAGNGGGGIASYHSLSMESCTIAGNGLDYPAPQPSHVVSVAIGAGTSAVRSSIIEAPYSFISPVDAANQRVWFTDLAGDPGFLDPARPAGADGIWLTADDGYRPADGSRCLEWSAMTTPGYALPLAASDLAGAPRPQNRDPEPGCYEHVEAGGLAPQAEPLAATLREGDATPVPLTVAISDPDGTTPRLVVATLPAIGALLPTLDGATPSGPALTAADLPFTAAAGVPTVLLDLPADAAGTAAFQVYARDVSLASATAAVTVVIQAVNDAPVLDPIAPLPDLLEDGPVTVLSLTGIGPGAPGWEDGQTLTVTVAASDPALIPADRISVTPVSAGAATVSFTTAPDAYGDADLVVTVHDDGGTADGGVDAITALVAVHVRPVNDAPRFTIDQATLTVDEDAGAIAIPVHGVVPGPANESGAVQILAALAASGAGRLVITGIDQPDAAGEAVVHLGTVADANGTAEVVITALDAGGTADGGVSTAVQVVTVAIVPVEDPVVITAGTLAVAAGSATAALTADALLASDADQPDPGTLVFTLVTPPARGALLRDGAALAAGGTFTMAEVATGTRLVYRSDDGGEDAFAVEAGDGIQAVPSGPATVAVTVGSEHGLGIPEQWVATLQDVARTCTLTALHPGSPAVTWSLVEGAERAAVTVVDAAAGVFRIVPAAGRSGEDGFTVRVADGVSPPAERRIPLAITGTDQERPQPAGDPPHAVQAGGLVQVEVGWDVARLAGAGALDFIAVGDAPAGLSLSAVAADRLRAEWTEPAASGPAVYRRFGLLAVEPVSRRAGYLPLTLRAAALPSGSN